MSDVTYTVSIRGVEPRRGTKGTIVSYRVTWRVSRKVWRKTFETKKQADSYRASLLSAARNGEPYLVTTGLPLSWAPRSSDLTWYAFTLDYTTMKWPTLSPGSRRGVAEALTDATEALMTRPVHVSRDELRAALRWAYSIRIRDDPEPPDQLRTAIVWLDAHTVQMDAFTEPASRSRLVRDLLTRITQT